MDARQVKGVSLPDEPLLDPNYDDMVGTIHTCPECGMNLSVVECSPGCPHWLDCEDRELHVSAGVAWCPVYQVIETDGLLERLLGRTHVTPSEGQTAIEDFVEDFGVSVTHVSLN